MCIKQSFCLLSLLLTKKILVYWVGICYLEDQKLALKLFFIFKHLDKLILETFLQAILGSTEFPHFRDRPGTFPAMSDALYKTYTRTLFLFPLNVFLPPLPAPLREVIKNKKIF